MALATCRECGAEVSPSAKDCPKCGARRPIRRRSYVLAGLGILMAITIIAHVSQLRSKGAATTAVSPELTTASVDPDVWLINHARDSIKIMNQKSELTGFDTIMKGSITLKNTNAFAVKDFTIICANYAASGTELPATTARVLEILKPGQTKTFYDVDYGFIPQGMKRYGCFVGGAHAY